MNRNLIEFARQNAPCYIYEKSEIDANCIKLQNAIPNVQFLYSIKANPFGPVVSTIASHRFGADAASPGEVIKAESAGIPPERVYYSAPGKTVDAIEKAWGKCIFIADSFSELAVLNECAEKRGMILSVGIRVNPLFSMDGQNPLQSKFGIDEELLESSMPYYANLKVSGIHIHLKSQILDADTLCLYYERCYALAERLAKKHGWDIRFINFGSGIGTVYDECLEKPLNLEKIALTLEGISKQSRTLDSGTEFILETGRFLVSGAGTYFTKIVDRKVSRGKTYLIVENAVNGFLRPEISQLLRLSSGSYPADGLEPFYTSEKQCSFTIPGRKGTEEKVDIVGNLCTAVDVMARDISLPPGEIGDIIAVSNAGSYGYSLSPLLFSGHEKPGEFMW